MQLHVAPVEEGHSRTPGQIHQQVVNWKAFLLEDHIDSIIYVQSLVASARSFALEVPVLESVDIQIINPSHFGSVGNAGYKAA